MAYLGGFYLNNPHVSQFDGSPWQGENCTPTSAANGINAISGGKYKPTGGRIRNLVGRNEELVRATPGWAIQDVDLAMTRYRPPYGFTNHSGKGWNDVVRQHQLGLYLVAQGDSDQFSNHTCSGAFNGNHCIGISPITRQYNGREQWWIDDPICNIGRWEYRVTIYHYMNKLSPSMRFGVFTTPVPREPTKPLWGSDVPMAIRALNPTGVSMGRAIIKATGKGFGTVINLSDIRRGLLAIGRDPKIRIDPIDAKALLVWYGKHK